MASEKPTLHIYVVHSQALTLRALKLHGTIQEIRMTAIGAGYRVLPTMVVKHDPADVQAQLAEVQKKISYEGVGDARFDGLRQLLSLEVISNINKHMDAWLRITRVEPSSPKDLFMVIEDDAHVLPDGMQNLGALLREHLSAPSVEWDMVMLGICCRDDEKSKSDGGLRTYSWAADRVLPSKDTYIVTQATAARLLSGFEKYRFSMRIQLSHWLQTQGADIRVAVPRLPIVTDGSKLGTCPSSLHPSNFLIYNREFTMLASCLNMDAAALAKAAPQIKSTYDAVRHIRNPDIMHVYGVLLYKMGEIQSAERILREAIGCMREQQGMLNARGDLMNNLVQLYQGTQGDVSELTRCASVYDDPAMALATFE